MPQFYCLRCFAEMARFLGPQSRRARYQNVPRLERGRCPVCGGRQALDPRIVDRKTQEDNGMHSGASEG